MSIAEQMGLRLENTAYSVNIKERLDFSCAVRCPGPIDRQRAASAGASRSMGESIRTVMRENAGRIKPGNVYVLNAPYNGGTHLPDITVMTPVFDDARHPVLRRLARPATPTSAASPRLDAAGQHGGGRRGRADRQLPAGGGRAPARAGHDRAPLRRAGTRRATSSRTWPTCAR